MLRADPAASEGPSAFAEAVSERHSRRVFFPEERRGQEVPGVDPHGADRFGEPGPHHHYVICNDKPTLLYLANLGCIDQNPWMSRVGSLDNPDFVLIDLDPTNASLRPDRGGGAADRKALDEIGLAGYPKTTGGDGMQSTFRWSRSTRTSRCGLSPSCCGTWWSAQKPDLFTTPRAVAQRKKGRVYFDYLQIGESKTIAAPYVLRAHDGRRWRLRWSGKK